VANGRSQNTQTEQVNSYTQQSDRISKSQFNGKHYNTNNKFPVQEHIEITTTTIITINYQPKPKNSFFRDYYNIP